MFDPENSCLAVEFVRPRKSKIKGWVYVMAIVYAVMF
jgi:hypothetical protein